MDRLALHYSGRGLWRGPASEAREDGLNLPERASHYCYSIIARFFSGLLFEDKSPDICFSVTTTDETHLVGARVLDKKGQPTSTSDIHKYYPLLTRGWVLQERLLSPRLLQCNYGEFTFDCLESSYCECNSSLAPHPRKTQLPKSFGNSTYRKRRFVQGNTQKPGVRDAWRGNAIIYWESIVDTYMQLELSFPSDVLSAIAGCAKVMSHHLQFTYVAGLWKEKLPTDLLWYVAPQKQGSFPMPRPKDSTAPSWSWASVSMTQTIKRILWYRDDTLQTSEILLRDAIKEVYCEPMSVTKAFGKLKNAYLKLDVILYPWYLRCFCLVGQQAQSANNARRNLYIKLSRYTSCTTEIEGLVADGISIDCRLDGRLGDEGPVFETFSHCSGGPSYPCTLVQVYLLHALHKKNLSKAYDVFLLLIRAPPVKDMPSCYRRIGLIQLTSVNSNIKTWDELIQGKIKPRKEEFWLF
jgi:hypothetical protein